MTKTMRLLPRSQSAKTKSTRLYGAGRWVLCVAFVLGFISVQAQNQIVSNKESRSFLNVGQEDTVVTSEVDVIPMPPGGFSAFRRWIGKNYNVPRSAIKAKLNGTVSVSFVVERDGSLSDIEVTDDLGYGTTEEAIRLIESSKKWTPGILNGDLVRVQFTLPIRLDLRKK